MELNGWWWDNGLQHHNYTNDVWIPTALPNMAKPAYVWNHKISLQIGGQTITHSLSNPNPWIAYVYVCLFQARINDQHNTNRRKMPKRCLTSKINGFPKCQPNYMLHTGIWSCYILFSYEKLLCNFTTSKETPPIKTRALFKSSFSDSRMCFKKSEPAVQKSLPCHIRIASCKYIAKGFDSLGKPVVWSPKF